MTIRPNKETAPGEEVGDCTHHYEDGVRCTLTEEWHGHLGQHPYKPPQHRPVAYLVTQTIWCAEGRQYRVMVLNDDDSVVTDWYREYAFHLLENSGAIECKSFTVTGREEALRRAVGKPAEVEPPKLLPPRPGNGPIPGQRRFPISDLPRVVPENQNPRRHTATRRFLIHEACFEESIERITKHATLVKSTPVGSPFPGYIVTLRWDNTMTQLDDPKVEALCDRSCAHKTTEQKFV